MYFDWFYIMRRSHIIWPVASLRHGFYMPRFQKGGVSHALWGISGRVKRFYVGVDTKNVFWLVRTFPGRDGRFRNASGSGETFPRRGNAPLSGPMWKRFALGVKFPRLGGPLDRREFS